jgi:hypothetical protein
VELQGSVLYSTYEMGGECSMYQGERNVYRVLVGKSEGNRPLTRPWHRWEIILKWILNKYNGRTWAG